MSTDEADFLEFDGQAVMDVGRQFATSLDHRRYDDLAVIFDPDCKYHFRGKVVEGSKKIIEEYREGTEWAFDRFDEIKFFSDVTAVSESMVRVKFTDQLHFGDTSHTFRCEQLLTINSQQRIVRIEHIDLEGEVDSLHDFLHRCGIQRAN